MSFLRGSYPGPLYETLSAGAKAVSKLEKVAAPFFKEGVKAKIKSVGLKNLAKETVNTMATGSVYGAATEGLRSFIAGEDGEDTLASTIMGSIFGAGIGLVAGPVLTVVGAFAGRKTLWKLKQTIKTNLEKYEKQIYCISDRVPVTIRIIRLRTG